MLLPDLLPPGMKFQFKSKEKKGFSPLLLLIGFYLHAVFIFFVFASHRQV